MTKWTKYVGVNTSLIGPIVITEHNGQQNELDVDIVCVENSIPALGYGMRYLTLILEMPSSNLLFNF